MKLILKIFIALILALAICMLAAERLHDNGWLAETLTPPDNEGETSSISKESKALFPSPLTGEGVEEELLRRTPVAVVIDNQIDARPQSGLSSACIVYEIPTEGGITRFLAFFYRQLPSKIGPVRSLRLAFLDIIPEYDAVLIHAGGDTRALKKIKSGDIKIRNLDQFQSGRYFWREKSRQPPYNLYTSGVNLFKALKDKGWEYISKSYESFSFTTPPQEKGDIKEVEIKNSPASYGSLWVYDKESNAYTRNQAGKPHNDELTGENITTKNLLILIVKGKVTTTLGHLDLEIVGEGKTYLFRDGQIFEGKWKKPSPDSRLELTGITGEKMTFTVGKIWISLLTREDKLRF